MTEEQALKLEYPFAFDEIEWRVLRVSKKDPRRAQIAAYVDSRAIQNRLDSTVGRENWQNSFETVTGANNDATANICKLSIYYKERGEWISKSDGAGCTDVEPIKGGLSNAFKRAASMWGIGRYLYGLKNIWSEIDEYKCITQDSLYDIERRYNQYVNKYLQAKFGSGKAHAQNQTKPKDNTASTQSEYNSATTVNIPNGRFNAQPSNQQQNSGCRILDLQVTRGAKSSQTLVTLENSQGKKVQGYIQGEPELKQGQYIFNPKIITKNSPLVGNYNIIESYNIAA